MKTYMFNSRQTGFYSLEFRANSLEEVKAIIRDWLEVKRLPNNYSLYIKG